MVNNMNERHPDRESYLYICNELIEKEICNYCDVYKDSLELIPNWKEEIWDNNESNCLFGIFVFIVYLL